MSRCDGSWDNYPPSWCVCKCKMKQGLLSGSPPAQVSEQLMTVPSEGMKEMAVVCSQLHTTFLLLSAVCLNLPGAVFTPQGDHVIRFPPLLVCHPAAPLLQRGTAGAEERKQYKQSGGHRIKCSSFTGSESVVAPFFFKKLLGSCSFLCRKGFFFFKKKLLFTPTCISLRFINQISIEGFIFYWNKRLFLLLTCPVGGWFSSCFAQKQKS